MEFPLIFRFKGAIIHKIWWQVILVSIYSAGLVYTSNYVEGWEINFPPSLVSVLGLVTGLLLVFRTSSAYDRWWEGRKLWSTMTFNIRTLTRCIWVMVKKKEDENKEKEDNKVIVEKVSAINVLLAFAFATTKYLKGEDDGYLEVFLQHIPNFTPEFLKVLKVQEKNNCFARCWGNQYMSTLMCTACCPKKTESQSDKHDISEKYKKRSPANIPLELSYFIAQYIEHVYKEKLAPDFAITTMNNALTNLVECLGGIERIWLTPIPVAYSIHLAHATWLFILAMPFQLIGTLNWYTIPAVTIASFALLGILEIGMEIQNPFGNEYNDLPMKKFCSVLYEEVLLIVGYPMPPIESWLLSPKNQPLMLEVDSAPQLIALETNELREKLKQGTCLIHHLKAYYKTGAKLSSYTYRDAGGENEELVP